MKIGDRVEIKKGFTEYILPFSQGTLVYLNVNCPNKDIHSVQWDIKPTMGHNCNGYATDNKGYNVSSESLQVIKGSQETPEALLQRTIEQEVSKLTD